MYFIPEAVEYIFNENKSKETLIRIIDSVLSTT